MVTTEADMNICNPLAPGGHNTHPTVTLGARWVQKVKVYCIQKCAVSVRVTNLVACKKALARQSELSLVRIKAKSS